VLGPVGQTLLQVDHIHHRVARWPVARTLHGLYAASSMLLFYLTSSTAQTTDAQAYFDQVSTSDLPADFSERLLMLPRPLFMRIAEHHCISPANPVSDPINPEDPVDNSVWNAWLLPIERTSSDSVRRLLCNTILSAD
jgi:hypothetical protein